MPEPHVAGRFFFRFDPGFRAEFEAARRYGLGTAQPLSMEGLDDEAAFNLSVRVHNHRKLWEAAYGLAAWWQLDPPDVVQAVAFDADLTLPYVTLIQGQVDEVTGLRYTDIRVYSEFAWRGLRRSLEELPGGAGLRSMGFLADRSAVSPMRVRGMDPLVAARTMALHFLISARPGRRRTDGIRTWPQAVELWNRHSGLPSHHIGTNTRSAWQKGRERLIGLVLDRLPSPGLRLMSLQMAGRLGDTALAQHLGIAVTDWSRIRREQAVPRRVWDQIGRAIPALAEDLMDQATRLGLVEGEGIRRVK